MTNMNAPVLDLLRQRRESLGVDSLAEALADRPSLLRKGALIGAATVGTVLGALALVFVSHQVVKARMGELVKYEGEANALRAEVAATRALWLEGLIGARREVLAERDGTGHSPEFAPYRLPEGTAPGTLVMLTPTRIREGLLE